MKYHMAEKKEKAFTIVELVIVIAIIAILAAVLIPSFSDVINKARLSDDKEKVDNINKILIIDFYGKDNTVKLDDVEKSINDGGYETPLKMGSDDCAVFWIPNENKVTLFDFEKGGVIYPNDCTDKERTTQWVNLSEEISTEPEEQETEEPEETQPESVEEKVFVLSNGNSVNKKLKNLNKNAEKIVFGKIFEYEDKTHGNSESISSDGKIKAYLNGNEIYILSDGIIQTGADASEMFSDMEKLKSITFGNFNTENATDMSDMFSGCKGLSSLDLSNFNTAKTQDTSRMFYDCVNLTSITVKTATNLWNMSKVKSSASMFLGCEKLPNYNLSVESFWDSLKMIWETIMGKPDVSYAHTGDGGFLTEK